MQLLPGYSNAAVVLALATAVGAWGGFPAPPARVSELMSNPMVQWGLVAVLVWQGGAGQDLNLALMVTALMWAATHLADRYL